MSRLSTLTTAAVAAALALAIPAVASAHPSVYFSTAKIAATPEIQTLTATGGNWSPTTGAATIADTATAAQVQDAFAAATTIGYTASTGHTTAPGYDNVRVTGANGGPYTVTFVGTLAGVNVDALTPTGASVVTSQNGGTPVTYSGSPTADQAAMADQQQAVVVSDGYAIGYRETNGVGPGGLLNLSKILPGSYRSGMTMLQKLAYAPAQTSIQLHATCTGVAALSDRNNISTVWARSDNDPFYNYIPWQPTKAGIYTNGALVAGFGDDPSKWIGVVKTITNGLPGAPAGGVDLTTLTTTAALTSACQALGGTYRPADTASNITSAVVADATTPIAAQVTSLTTQVGSLVPQLATLTSENAALKAAAQPAPAKRPLALTLGAKKLNPSALTTMVTGVAGQSVTVKLTVTKAVAKALKLKSATLATKTTKFNDQGAALLSLAAGKSAVKALAKSKSSLTGTVTAASGSETKTASGRFAS